MGATLFGATSFRVPEQSGGRRRDNLAFVFQEILTAIVRLRANRQTTNDARVFRTHMQNALRTAEREGISKGYSPEDVRLATFAVVAFLDESILNSNNPVFSDWPRMPLQEEMFGHHEAGITFFQNVDKFLGRSDSHAVADLLELYSLCVLLGYKGKYGLGEADSTRPVLDSIADKVRRIRGPLPGLSPMWAIPEGNVKVTEADPWIRRLVVGAATSVVLALVLFLIFKVWLGGGVSDAHSLAASLQW